MAHRELERVEHHGESREKEVKIKVETSTRGVHHYEASIRTIGLPEELNVDLLYEEAMHLMDRMDTAMEPRRLDEQRSGGLLE